MTIFIITFIVMAVVIAAMAIGVIFGKEAIRGTCGGLNNGTCLCIKKCEKKRRMERIQEAR